MLRITRIQPAAVGGTRLIQWKLNCYHFYHPSCKETPCLREQQVVQSKLGYHRKSQLSHLLVFRQHHHTSRIWGQDRRLSEINVVRGEQCVCDTFISIRKHDYPEGRPTSRCTDTPNNPRSRSRGALVAVGALKCPSPI